jgi:hypothetical protein
MMNGREEEDLVGFFSFGGSFDRIVCNYKHLSGKLIHIPASSVKIFALCRNFCIAKCTSANEFGLAVQLHVNVP